MSDLVVPKPFNPADAVEAIRAKIRGAMLEIIPDEQWNSLIKAEMAAFTTDTTVSSYGRDEIRPAGFKVVVREMLEKDLRERVAEMLRSPEWSRNWDKEGRPMASEAVEKYITENAGKIMSSWIAGAVQSVISQLPYHVNR